MHKYWASKPWYVVSEYIKHFTDKGDIVLDPFCGSGVVACEALINRRKAVANDINPIATFITKNTCCAPIDMNKLYREFHRIESNVKHEVLKMYELTDHCPECGATLYAKHIVRGPLQKGKWIVEARCLNCGSKKGSLRRFLEDKEKEEISRIEQQKILYWYPIKEFLDGREIMRLKRQNIRYVHQLFTLRNLKALSMLFKQIQEIKDEEIKQIFLLCFSNTLLHVSKLKSESLRPMSANSYYCMDDWIEENVWLRFENRFKWHWGVAKGKEETNRLIGNYYRPANSFNELLKDGTFLLLNQSATDLYNIPDNSIDYCFTDPPYGGSIQYFELTYVWRTWLQMEDEFINDEIIVNDFQQKNKNTYELMLSRAFSEIYRVLKPGRWMTVTFNNLDQKIWMALINACRKAGFEKVNIVLQEPVGKSFVQSWASRSVKRDLILNFRKPKSGYKTASKKTKTFTPEEIIYEAAYAYLKNRKLATLAELYEAAVAKWIDYVYGYHDKLTENLMFNIENVDELLKEHSDFIRIVNNKGIFYSLKK